MAASERTLTAEKTAPQRRSKVAQVSFVEDAAQPAAKSATINAIRSLEPPADAPLPNSEFEIRDPAKDQPAVKISWK
jgi:hypothetical protein